MHLCTLTLEKHYHVVKLVMVTSPFFSNFFLVSKWCFLHKKWCFSTFTSRLYYLLLLRTRLSWTRTVFFTLGCANLFLCLVCIHPVILHICSHVETLVITEHNFLVKKSGHWNPCCLPCTSSSRSGETSPYCAP